MPTEFPAPAVHQGVKGSSGAGEISICNWTLIAVKGEEWGDVIGKQYRFHFK